MKIRLDYGELFIEVEYEESLSVSESTLEEVVTTSTTDVGRSGKGGHFFLLHRKRRRSSRGRDPRFDGGREGPERDRS